MKLDFEHVFLAVFMVIFLATGMGVYEQKLSHEFPVGYFASDAFFHQAEATYMTEQGKVKYASPAIVGGRTDVYDIHPPFTFAAVGPLAIASGLKVYDLMYLFIILLLLLITLLMYAIIRQYNRNVAMMSIPISLLVFTFPFNQMIGFGQWLFVPGALFMIAMMWATTMIDNKKSFIVLGLFGAATALAHQPELFFAAIFCVIIIIIKIVNSKNPKLLIPAIGAGAFAFILSAYSLNIFRITWLHTLFQDYKIGLTADEGVAARGFTDITFSTLGFGLTGAVLIGTLIVAGIAITILLIVTKKKQVVPGEIGIFILIISLLTFLGFSKRAFAHRWLWHIYFGFFFGLALYYGLKMLIKNWKTAYSAGIALILTVLFASSSFGQTHGSLVDKNSWEAMEWLSQNSAQDKIIYVFDAGRMQQSSILYNTKRVTRPIRVQAYEAAFKEQSGRDIKTIEDLKLAKEMEFGLSFGYVELVCGGPFQFGYYKTYFKSQGGQCEQNYGEAVLPKFSTKICDMDYYYLNVIAERKGLEFVAVYNQALANRLLKNSWIKKEYSNAAIMILKNEKPGEECLA